MDQTYKHVCHHQSLRAHIQGQSVDACWQNDTSMVSCFDNLDQTLASLLAPNQHIMDLLIHSYNLEA